MPERRESFKASPRELAHQLRGLAESMEDNEGSTYESRLMMRAADALEFKPRAVICTCNRAAGVDCRNRQPTQAHCLCECHNK